MNIMPRGWVPVDGQELWERGWDLPEIESRIRRGNLQDVINEYGRHIFESSEQHRRYMHLRRRPAYEYEASERYHLLHAEVVYGRACPDTEVLQEKSTLRRVWDVFWIVIQILALPLTILGMREGTQWFLGTGKYGGCEE